MLIQHIVDLLPEVSKLTPQEQEAIAIDIYAELVDAKFRRKIENSEPIPVLEQALREAQESVDRDESVSMDDWLAGGQLWQTHRLMVTARSYGRGEACLAR